MTQISYILELFSLSFLFCYKDINIKYFSNLFYKLDDKL
jgi:hypothetical protein